MQAEQARAELTIRVGIFCFELDTSAAGVDRFLRTIQLQQHDAEIEIRGGVIRLESHRLHQLVDRLLIALLGVKDFGEPEMEIRGAWLQSDRFPNQRFALPRIAGKVREIAQAVQRVDLARNHDKHLTKERRRFGKLAGVLVLKGKHDGVANVHEDACSTAPMARLARAGDAGASATRVNPGGFGLAELCIPATMPDPLMSLLAIRN